MIDIDIVTGGMGFIGNRLVETLNERNRIVHVMDLPETDIRNCALEYLSPNIQIGTIYHLAALADIVPSVKNPRDYYNTNVTGTLNVLEFARKHGCKKFVYVASASCYGMRSAYLRAPMGKINLGATPEEWPCAPEYPYALTKYLGEQLVMHWHKVYGINAVSARIFNAYGEGQRTSNSYGAMFKVFLAQLANSKPLTIVGDGEQCRDFIHVDDVASGLICLSERGKDGEAYNLASGVKTSVNEIVGLLGASAKVNIPKRPGEPDVTWGDIAKIKALGWEPKVRIDEGVARLLARLGEYVDAPVWTPDTIANATKDWFERLSA